MSAATPRRLAWVLALLSLSLYLAAVVVDLTVGPVVLGSQTAFPLVIIAGFSIVGVLIASSPDRNPIGWIYSVVALTAGLSTLAHAAAVPWLAAEGTRTYGELAAVVSGPAWIGWVLVPATFLLLLFPDGHLLSHRWQFVAWCAGIGIAGEFLVVVFTPGPTEDFRQVINPIGVELPALAEPATLFLCLVAVVGSAMSLVIRFRQVSGLQRQQIKWLAYAGAIAAPTVIAGVVAYDYLGADLANAVIQFAVLGVPLAAGVAILRYRLYDIDVVVNRTLVYGTLTATLAGAYLAGVLLLQLVVGGFARDSNLAVAGSTLAVAALFRPLRGRIQSAVDRRFYRNRYDATRTLAAFGGRLRAEVDLRAMIEDLRSVVQETVQPVHVSLWMVPSKVRS